MKDFDEYAKSGALAATVGQATREAGMAARAHGLPSTAPIKVPTFIVAALSKPPVRKSPVLSR